MTAVVDISRGWRTKKKEHARELEDAWEEEKKKGKKKKREKKFVLRWEKIDYVVVNWIIFT